MALNRLIFSAALLALFFATCPSTTAQPDIGIERIVQIFASQEIPTGIFSDKLLQRLPLDKLQQTVGVVQLAAGNYKGCARASGPPADARLSPFSHYVVT